MATRHRVLATVMCGIVGQSYAMTVGDFEAMQQSPDDSAVASVYIAGLGEGASWMEAAMVENGMEKRIYCVPAALGLNGHNYLAIYQDQVKRLRERGTPVDDMEVGAVLLIGLQHTFPCD